MDENHEIETKKRKMEEIETGNDESTNESGWTEEQLRSLLEHMDKAHLVDLLSKIGSQYPSIAEEIKSVASSDPVHRKLYVRGLAWNTTSEALCAAYGVHGEIEEGSVIYDKATGKSRGYAFITYKDIEAAQAALKARGKLIDGRFAMCNLACEGTGGAAVPTPDFGYRKLFIGGLSTDVTSEMLLDFFLKHGEIEEGSVAYDKDTGESRGFGFVTYKTPESAKKALDDPYKLLGGRAIAVKLAETKIKQKPAPPQMQMQMQPMQPMQQVMVPMSVAMAGGYHPQPPKQGHRSPATHVTYAYPQNVAQYPTTYPSPPSGSTGVYPQYIPKH